MKKWLKQTIQKMLVTTPKKIIVRTPRENWKIFQIQTNLLENKEPLKTDKTKNVGDNTKEDDIENFKEKLKDISSTDKETYE